MPYPVLIAMQHVLIISGHFDHFQTLDVNDFFTHRAIASTSIIQNTFQTHISLLTLNNSANKPEKNYTARISFKAGQ